MQIMRDKDLCHHEYAQIIVDGNYIIFDRTVFLRGTHKSI